MLRGSDWLGDRPLAAGNLGLFHPESLAFQVNLSRREITSLNAGDTLSFALRESRETASGRDVFATVPLNTKHFVALRAHEHDHLRRHVGTTYGMFAHAIRSSITELVLAAVRDLATARSANPFPLLLRRSGEWSASNSLINGAAFLSQYRGLRWLDEGLDVGISNHQAASVRSVINRFLANPKATCDIVWNPKASAEARSFAPVIARQGIQRQFGARPLLELFGIGQQGNLLAACDAGMEEIARLLLDSPDYSDYRPAIELWHTFFPHASIPDPWEQPRQSDESRIDWYRLFPMELYAAADLALWPPFSPRGITGIDDSVHWGDIHPGARFCRILLSLQASDRKPRAIGDSSKDQDFTDLQAELCEQLGWPTPVSLAAEWRDTLQSATTDTAYGRPFRMTGPATYRRLLSATLMGLRLLAPGRVVLNCHPDLAKASSPVWLFNEVGGAVDATDMVGGDVMSAPATEFLLLDGLRLLCEGRSRYIELLSKGVRLQAVNCVCDAVIVGDSGPRQWLMEMVTRFFGVG